MPEFHFGRLKCIAKLYHNFAGRPELIAGIGQLALQTVAELHVYAVLINQNPIPGARIHNTAACIDMRFPVVRGLRMLGPAV